MIEPIDGNLFPLSDSLQSKPKQWAQVLEGISFLITHGNKEDAQIYLAKLLDQMNEHHPSTKNSKSHPKLNQAIQNLTNALSQLNSGFPNAKVVSTIEDTIQILILFY